MQFLVVRSKSEWKVLFLNEPRDVHSIEVKAKTVFFSFAGYFVDSVGVFSSVRRPGRNSLRLAPASVDALNQQCIGSPVPCVSPRPIRSNDRGERGWER
jgi:hypothetical protein